MEKHTTPSANLRKTLLTIAIADKDGAVYHADTIAAKLVDLPLPYLSALWRGAERAYSAKLADSLELETAHDGLTPGAIDAMLNGKGGAS